MAYDADDVSDRKADTLEEMVGAAHTICDTSPRRAFGVVSCAKFYSQGS
jgi:hypothetical protein